MQGTETNEGSEGAAIDQLTPEEYAKQRAEYVKSGKGKPPPGAEPLPMAEEPASE